jgi:uncharacterized NAD(P)/FAD-binding protein YdhS
MQMSVLVEQQDETINGIEIGAAGVEKDTEVGYVSTCWNPSVQSTHFYFIVLATLTELSYQPALLAKSDGFVSSSF